MAKFHYSPAGHWPAQGMAGVWEEVRVAWVEMAWAVAEMAFRKQDIPVFVGQDIQGLIQSTQDLGERVTAWPTR